VNTVVRAPSAKPRRPGADGRKFRAPVLLQKAHLRAERVDMRNDRARAAPFSTPGMIPRIAPRRVMSYVDADTLKLAADIMRNAVGEAGRLGDIQQFAEAASRR
jgi:hypothetical protein